MSIPQRTKIEWGVLLLVLSLGSPALFTDPVCNERTGSAAVHFASTVPIDLTNSPAKFWCHDPVAPNHVVTLNKIGGIFQTRDAAAFPAWIDTVTAGDFDLDGWTDFIASSSGCSNVLVFVRNMGAAGSVGTFTIARWIDGCGGNPSGQPNLGVQGQPVDTEGNISLTSGDYDGDGDADFFFVSGQTASPYAPERIWLYRNNLVTDGVRGAGLTFTQVDLTSAWAGRLGGIGWTGRSMASVRQDSDADIDILFGNSAGRVLKLTNTSNGAVDSGTFLVEPTPLVETGWTGRGVSAVAAADFDRDSDMDIVVGGVGTNVLRYYKNDGSGDYDLFATWTDKLANLANDLFDGAASSILSGDFDADGDPDFVVATDNYNYPANNGSSTGYGGKVYLFRNAGSDAITSKLVFNGPALSTPVNDLDGGLAMDYDNDRALDVLLTEDNHARNPVILGNTVGAVYNMNGFVVSANLTPALDSDQYAITRVRMTTLTQGVVGSSTGLTVSYFVSNNDGMTWEAYADHAGADIKNYTDLPWRNFSSFGSHLRWKAVFAAPADNIAGYANASNDTPSLDEIAVEYTYVDRREYSRTTDPVTTLKIDGQNIKALFAATFYFPGYQGQLRAYDLTNVAMTNTPNSVLKTISSSDPSSLYGRSLSEGAALLWDAGSLLNSRTADSRHIYTSAGRPLVRIEFTRANVAALADLIRDNDGDNIGLIDFIRGEGRDWRLGDIQHSNPVILGPPARDVIAMGPGYAEYAQALAGRDKVIFVGANDGMLHCFAAETGGELWGYIPNNLLSKLKNLSIRNRETGFRAPASDYFVDGSCAVADVFINGAWRSVLVCGQGAGKSLSTRSGLNYYFALDVTDPQNPQPLWELSDSKMGETWSIPAIGRVRDGGTDRWVAFMGSGYDNDSRAVVGNVFYVVALDTGAIIRAVAVDNVDTSALPSGAYPDIQVAIPGSPTAVDSNKDGFTDAIYVGDLDGRMWKLSTVESHPNSWTMTAIYSDRHAYPIITEPSAWQDALDPAAPVHVLFGTGGDDRAPSDRTYAFLSVVDAEPPAVEWYLGDPTELGLDAETASGSMETGEKVWADPVMADFVVYFNTLKGSIENVNPCLNLAEAGKLYARFVRAMAGGTAGATALLTASGPAESFQLTSKARRMVTVGDKTRVGQSTKREIYIQEYDSSIQRLEQGGGRVQMIIKSWREVYQIIR